MDNNGVYCGVYQNKDQGSLLLELCSLVGFQKIKMHFA